MRLNAIELEMKVHVELVKAKVKELGASLHLKYLVKWDSVGRPFWGAKRVSSSVRPYTKLRAP